MFSPVMEGNLYRPQPCSTGDRLNRRAPNEEALITASRFLSPPLERKRDFDRAPFTVRRLDDASPLLPGRAVCDGVALCISPQL